jgi:hydroxypyruvate isomerase
MPSANRREFLAAAGAGAALVGLGSSSTHAQAQSGSGDGTWMTFAVNVEMTWGNLPFLDRLAKVAEAGFSHYEFWPWRGKDIDGIIKTNQRLNLVPVQFSASPKRFSQGITDPKRKDEFVEDMKLAVGVAKRLNVKKLCVVAGEETAGLSRDEQTNAVIEALKLGAKIVEPEGVTIILEPLNILVDHPKQLVVYSEHAARILRAVGSPNVKMLFDVYHQQISEGNLSGNIRKYKDLIGYYQIADHPGRHEPSTGEINYAHVFRVIHDTGYTGAIGMEMSPKSDPSIAFAAVRKADADAKALVSAK